MLVLPPKRVLSFIKVASTPPIFIIQNTLKSFGGLASTSPISFKNVFAATPACMIEMCPSFG